MAQSQRGSERKGWFGKLLGAPLPAVQFRARQGEINGFSKQPVGASCSIGPPMTTRTPTPEKSPRGTQPKTWGAERDRVERDRERDNTITGSNSPH